jgi:hypothetical protein
MSYETHLLIELPLVIKNLPKFHLMSSPEQVRIATRMQGFRAQRCKPAEGVRNLILASAGATL